MDPVSNNVASSLAALTNQYEATTSNLANASTIGYKRRVTAFSQELQRQMAVGTEAANAVSQVNSHTTLDFGQGAIAQSSNPMDLAIQGEGFFAIQTPTGEMYTRNGCFRLSDNRQLVDANGHLVAGDGGPITVPSTTDVSQLHVGTDGTVSTGDTVLGKIKVVTFAKEDVPKLLSLGMGIYQAPPDVSPSPATNTTIAQGYRESSNVNVVEELVNMITVSRMYEAGVKTIHTEDERLKTLVQTASMA